VQAGFPKRTCDNTKIQNTSRFNQLGCALAACLLFLPPDDARTQAVQAVEITEFGIYTTDNPTSSAAPGTASGWLPGFLWPINAHEPLICA
jgi:hypothetical protein